MDECQSQPTADSDANKGKVHGWPGKLFIGVNYFSAGAALLGLLVFIASIFSESSNEKMGTVEVLLLGCIVVFATVVPIAVAHGMLHFRCWAWWVFMILFICTAVSTPFVVLDGQESAGRTAFLLALPAQLIWFNYFWKRREDFA